MAQMLARDKKQILIRVKPEIRKALRQIAADHDISLSVTIEKLIEANTEIQSRLDGKNSS